MSRTVSFEQAKAKFVNRYTMENVPKRAAVVNQGNGKYYAPQYSSDAEWYQRTFFKGESELATDRHCYSTCPSWPLGQWLDAPYSK